MKDLKGSSIKVGDKVVVNVQQVGLVEGKVLRAGPSSVQYKVTKGAGWGVSKGDKRMVQSSNRVYVVEEATIELPNVEEYTQAAKALVEMIK